MKKFLTTIWYIMFFSVSCAAEPAGQDAFPRLFQGLRDGAKQEDIDANFEALCNGGVKALTFLKEHLDDNEIAADKFSDLKRRKTLPDGKIEWERLKMGDVAFLIISRILEIEYPKRFQGYAIIDKENAQQWLNARKSDKLLELQIAAIDAALAAAIQSSDESAILFFKDILKNKKESGGGE
jgi:hypothetical protein